jgi:hypothetical protein
LVLPPDVEAAGAEEAEAGVAAVAGVLLVDAPESEAGLLAESDDFPSEPPLLSPPDFGLALPYPSAYHPPPLKETAGAEMTRSRGPLQKGQTVISASENFCIFSVCRWQAVHSYS